MSLTEIFQVLFFLRNSTIPLNSDFDLSLYPLEKNIEEYIYKDQKILAKIIATNNDIIVDCDANSLALCNWYKKLKREIRTLLPDWSAEDRKMMHQYLFYRERISSKLLYKVKLSPYVDISLAYNAKKILEHCSLKIWLDVNILGNNMLVNGSATTVKIRDETLRNNFCYRRKEENQETIPFSNKFIPTRGDLTSTKCIGWVSFGAFYHKLLFLMYEGWWIFTAMEYRSPTWRFIESRVRSTSSLPDDSLVEEDVDQWLLNLTKSMHPDVLSQPSFYPRLRLLTP